MASETYCSGWLISDSKYNVAIVTLHGILNVGYMYKYLLCVYCFFQLPSRVASYVCEWLATTTALCEVTTLT